MTTDFVVPSVTPIVLAIDPGKDKCGVAVVAASGEVCERRIYPPHEIPAAVSSLVEKYGVTDIALGNATTALRMQEELSLRLPAVRMTMVDETGSTLQARALYWQANPPRGWRRLTPLSMQVPPEPVDDFAAVVLAQRYFARMRETG